MLDPQTHQDSTTLLLHVSPNRMVQLEHSQIQQVQRYGPSLSLTGQSEHEIGPLKLIGVLIKVCSSHIYSGTPACFYIKSIGK